MKVLSKSRLLEFDQCPKRLWLQLHAPHLRVDSKGTLASFAVGHTVGEVARRLYDPAGKGAMVTVEEGDYAGAFARTSALLSSSRPIFEAGFTNGRATAFADVMLPARRAGQKAWRMVEVKSATELKDYYRTDAAIQAYIAACAGVPLASVHVAHIDSEWVYPGNDDYDGLLVEHDLTDEATARATEIATMIEDAHKLARRRKEPAVQTGAHCNDPYACGFAAYCASQEPQAEYPVAWIPGTKTNALRAALEEAADMREVPDALLNERQLRVKQCTVNCKTYFDAESARAALARHKLPAYFLDFETIYFAVPIWKGTRPYQQIPFQFSAHRLSRTGKLEQDGFLDLSGKDPSRSFIEALIRACGTSGPVFVYNAGFERARITDLAERFPRFSASLNAIAARLVDLLDIAKRYYYHPSQAGSWSIKKVLPAIVPELSYDALDGVQDGGMAMEAYLEAITPATTAARRAELRGELERYCGLDTYGLVKLWQHFTGRTDLRV